MAIFRRYLIAALLFCAAGGAVCVQAQTGVTPPPRQVSFKFTVFALGGLDGAAYLPAPESAPQTLKFYSACRSPTYKYKGEEQLRFLSPQADGNPPVVIAVYTVPEGAESLLLLFFPNEKPAETGLKYDVYGFDDSEEKTPAGSFSTINVSGREYAAQYGASRITIPHGIGAAHEGRGRVKLLLASLIDGGWMPAGKHEFAMGARDRVTLIFYPPANRTALYPIIRRLTDTLPPTEKKPGDPVEMGGPEGDL